MSLDLQEKHGWMEKWLAPRMNIQCSCCGGLGVQAGRSCRNCHGAGFVAIEVYGELKENEQGWAR